MNTAHVVVDTAGHWLNPAAAAALARALADGCPLEITSAGRTIDEQLELIKLHADDPVRYAYAAPVSGPQASEHITGNALDVGPDMAAWFQAHPAFGWVRTAYPVEYWHYAYRPTSDAHLVTSAAPTALATKPAQHQEDPMVIIRNNVTGAAFMLSGGKASGLTEAHDLQSFADQNVPIVNVAPGTYVKASTAYGLQ